MPSDMDAIEAAKREYDRCNAAYLLALRRKPHTDRECLRLLDLAGAAYARWLLALGRLEAGEVWRFEAFKSPP